MTFAMDGGSGRNIAPGREAWISGARATAIILGLMAAGPDLASADAGAALPAIRGVIGASSLAAAQTAPPSGEEPPPAPDEPDSAASPPKQVVAEGSPARAGATVLQAQVALRDAQAEEIRLVKDKSAVIRTNVAIARAQVTNPTIADIPVVTPQEVVVTAQAFGVTQLTLWTVDDQRKTFDIVVEIDVPMLNRAIKQLSPQSAVTARMLGGTLVLSGRTPDALTAERIEGLARVVHNRVANHLDVAGLQQTLLRCTVAEVNKEAIRELSVNWALGGGDISKDFFFANNLGGLNPTNFGDSGVMNLLAPPPVGDLLFNRAPTVTGPNTNFTFGFPRAELQFFLRALRDNNLFRVLAEPNVVAVNGQEASFLSGGEFPIAVAQGGAVAGAISIEFKQFGILLGFTPTVMGNGQIRMRVVAEVSDVIPGTVGTAGGLPVFSLSTRRVESTVECGDGQTFAVGGLLSERVRAATSRIPGLGDVPILGALFSSVRYQRNETELVILVTPELVAPMDPHQVPPVPGDELTEPDDYELFALGKMEGEPKPTPQTGEAARHGFAARVRPAAPPAAGEITLQGPIGTSDSDER